MTEVTVQSGGEIALPVDVCRRYGMAPNTTIRLIETPSGVLLIPLSNAPMEPGLRDELSQWQALSAESWDRFPYEDQTP